MTKKLNTILYESSFFKTGSIKFNTKYNIKNNIETDDTKISVDNKPELNLIPNRKEYTIALTKLASAIEKQKR